MSLKVTSLVWERSRAEGGTLLVALAIADFADDDGEAFPSIGALCRKSRLSERAVRYALRDLEALGELSTEIGAGPKGRNLYRIGGQILPGANAAGGQSATDAYIQGTVNKKSPPTPKVAWTGTALEVPEIVVASLRDAYPGVNVQAEIAKASAWCLANPEKRPRSQFGRFLNSWMGSAHRDLHKPASRANARTAQREQFTEWLFGSTETQPKKESANVVDVEAVEVVGSSTP